VFRIFPQSRFSIFAMIIGFLFTIVLQNGCTYCDGGFAYHVHGTLMDASTRQPLADAKVAVHYQLFEPNEDSPHWPGLSQTDSVGSFHKSFMTGLTWGYQELFGVIPLGNTKGPIPPELKTVILAVKRENGRWHVHEIPITPAQQKRAAPVERWIELGTISISQGEGKSRGSEN